MKVLFLYLPTGQGHYATSKALADYLQEQGATCELLDVYEQIAPLLNETVSRGYLFSASYAKPAYRKIYQIMDRVTKPASPYSPTQLVTRLLTHEIQDYILNFHADVIISSHVFASCMLDLMKKRGLLPDTLTLNIITDFTVHPLWQECSNMDYYIVASELLAYEVKRKGIPISKMLPFGIPIHPKFSQRIEQKEARRQLDLDPEKKTVLIMSGSMGFGHLDETIEKLDLLPLDYQALVVCGNNKRMYNLLKTIRIKKDFRIYGFVDNVDLMMDAADCIITKPGGLTSSEALAKGLPMIMINPIPGQEVRNVEFMLNNGLALYVTPTFPLEEAVYNLFSNQLRVSILRDTIQLLGKRNATQDLCGFIMHWYEERQTPSDKDCN